MISHSLDLKQEIRAHRKFIWYVRDFAYIKKVHLTGFNVLQVYMCLSVAYLLYLNIPVVYMRSFLLKICLFVVSCCFLTSATETDIGSYHQTFFDEYDTYAPCEKQILQVEKKQVSPQETVLVLSGCDTPFYFLFLLQPISFKSELPVSSLRKKDRKIFLHNSSFLIWYRGASFFFPT